MNQKKTRISKHLNKLSVLKISFKKSRVQIVIYTILFISHFFSIKKNIIDHQNFVLNKILAKK